MSDVKTAGRNLRSLWATLAVICLLGAGAAYGVTRYRLMELEQQADGDARRVAVHVIQPELTRADVSAPIRGQRLAEVGSAIEAGVLEGAVSSVRIWSRDGTIVFADDPKLIGEQDPAMRDEIHMATSGSTVHGFATGERFHSLVVMHVGKPPTLVAAELIRPHRPLVLKARDPWYPWVARSIKIAIAFAVLYVVTWVGFGMLIVVRRGSARRRAEAARAASPAPTRRANVPNADLPAYTQPGFREEIENRRRVEQELSSAVAERDELARRLDEVQAASAAPAGTGFRSEQAPESEREPAAESGREPAAAQPV